MRPPHWLPLRGSCWCGGRRRRGIWRSLSTGPTSTPRRSRAAALAANAERADTSLDDLQQDRELGTTLLEGDAEQQGFARAMGVGLAFLFHVAALGFGYTLSGSIVEEKANRIVEVIATKIPVRQLLIGKIAGNSLLAIAQTALMVTVGLIGISFTEYASFLPALSQGMGWFATSFLIGFCFIACWWAVAGALASRAEALQTTASPLTFLMMTVFFGSFLFDGTALTVASYVPPFSCVLMPIRVLHGDAAVREPVVAILLLLGAMAATVVLVERIYRRALLQTHGRGHPQAGLGSRRLRRMAACVPGSTSPHRPAGSTTPTASPRATAATTCSTRRFRTA